MKKIFSIIILLSSVACSSIQPINRQIINSKDHTGVELSIDDKSKLKTADDVQRIDIKKAEESIRIGDKGGEVFEDENQTPELKSEIKKLKIGLVFGPGLNRSVNYISVLKNLEKNYLSPSLITGTEMGAVVAALYASGITPEMIEWMFFKYFKDKKRYEAYGKDWIEEIDEYFLKKIKNNKLEDTKIKLIITLFDHNKKKVVYFDKGNIRDLVLLNLRSFNNPLKYKSGESYSGAYEQEIFNSKLIQNLGADYTLAVDAINSAISLEESNQELMTIFKNISNKANLGKRTFDYVLNLPDQKMKLDTNEEFQTTLQDTNEYMQKQVFGIKKRVQAKLDLLNTKIEE